MTGPGSSGLPVVTVRQAERHDVDLGSWPATLPCVRQVLERGLDLGPLTILVGENGSGKSTLLEAVAERFGFSPEGGTTHERPGTRPSGSPLARALWLERGHAASRWGFFLRAETMYGYATFLESTPGGHARLHELSHGESFLEVFSSRFDGPGLFVLDEPEAALSFTSSLALVGLLARIARSETAQALVATHSPLVAATPGARVLQVDDDGLTETPWRELEIVEHWTGFLADPELYLRHLADE